MPKNSPGFLLICLLLGSLCLPLKGSGVEKDRLAGEVKKEFLHAWNNYKKYAWGHDTLKPLTRTYRDWYPVSLVMTPLDALDTMLLMELEDEAETAKALIFKKLHFDHDFYVQNFEITIRILGGLITAYQLDGDRRFLNLAVDLADRLLPVFKSPTGMPYKLVNLRTGKTRDPLNNPAEIGTLILEFGTLSKITGDSKYFRAAKKAVQELFKRRSKIDLVGTVIDVETGRWIQTGSHISGMIDSYYEYLLKAWKLFGDEDFKTMWQTSITAVNRYLADPTPSGFWYGHADMHTGKRTRTWYGALDAFFPAVLVLEGELERAKRLQDSNFSMWNRYGIEPEILDYTSLEGVRLTYVLRPENIESAYYLYRTTGDEKYLEMGVTFFTSLKKYCRVSTGYTHLADVRTMKKADGMQSFFLAETLKYLYLLFAPADTLDFAKVIFNTEAHPIFRTWQDDGCSPGNHRKRQ
jgi:hypothetical protein